MCSQLGTSAAERSKLESRGYRAVYPGTHGGALLDAAGTDQEAGGDVEAGLNLPTSRSKLNERNVRWLEAVARDGVGVFETFSAMADLVTGRA